MQELSSLFQGFAVVLTPMNIGLMFVGIILGVLIGVLPGLGGANGVAILLPLTFSMSPTSAIVMLSCIYWGALFGGAITSVLFNIPGEPWSVATTFDGYPLAQRGKAGQALTTNEWLMGIRSRISIPGGTFEFDLPGYYAWQHEDVAQRQSDLKRWIATLTPLADALSLLLALLRESGHPHMVVASAGQYQQSLPAGRSFHLLRVRLPAEQRLVPEISGHRLMVSIRLMRSDAEGRLRPATEDASLELTLCS